MSDDCGSWWSHLVKRSAADNVTAEYLAWCEIERLTAEVAEKDKRIEELEAEVERHKRIFTHGGVDRFWRVWDEVGEPHIHGVYESTWGAFRRALDGEE